VTDANVQAEHHAGLKHQFENLEQQQDADTLGIWVFLVTEIMFFGGLFAAYAFIAGSTSLLLKVAATSSTSVWARSTRSCFWAAA